MCWHVGEVLLLQYEWKKGFLPFVQKVLAAWSWFSVNEKSAQPVWLAHGGLQSRRITNTIPSEIKTNVIPEDLEGLISTLKTPVSLRFSFLAMWTEGQEVSCAVCHWKRPSAKMTLCMSGTFLVCSFISCFILKNVFASIFIFMLLHSQLPTSFSFLSLFVVKHGAASWDPSE